MKLTSLLLSLRSQNYKDFYLRHLGFYEPKFGVSDNRKKISIDEIQTTFATAIEEYFTGKISFDSCNYVAGNLWWEIIHQQEEDKKDSSKIKSKELYNDELFWDLHFVDEGSFYAAYGLAGIESTISSNIISYINDLKSKYEKYNKKDNGNLILGKLDHLKCIVSVKDNEIQYKNSNNSILLSLPFPSKSFLKMIKENTNHLEALFLSLCVGHDLQKISVDTISAVSACILKSGLPVSSKFRSVLEGTQHLAILERYCAEDEKTFEELKSSVIKISNFLYSLENFSYLKPKPDTIDQNILGAYISRFKLKDDSDYKLFAEMILHVFGVFFRQKIDEWRLSQFAFEVLHSKETQIFIKMKPKSKIIELLTDVLDIPFVKAVTDEDIYDLYLQKLENTRNQLIMEYKI